MREEFYVETKNEAMMISADTVNDISQYLIAKVDTEDELNELLISKSKEQDARKKALMIAYKEYPIPPSYVPIETRQEIQLRRNQFVEDNYIKFISEL